MSLWDKIITQSKIDSSLLTELSDISYKSTKGKREKPRNLKEGIVDLGKIPFEVNPPKDKITKEMIEDYQKSQLEPLKDPVTGATLPNKYLSPDFKFEVADLQAPYIPVNFHLTGIPATQANINALEKTLNAILSDLGKANKDFKLVDERIRFLKDSINTGYVTLFHKKTGLRTARIALGPRQQKDFPIELTNLEAKIKVIENDIQAITTKYDNTKQLLEQAQENFSINKHGQIEHELDKKRNLNKYRDTLLTLNKSLYMDSQQPNETDEDYLKRMKAVETENYDMDLYNNRIELEQSQKFKNNLRKLFNKDDLIENIVKSFKTEQQFTINKHFPQIQEYFLDIYGKNNSNLSLKDIVEIITSHLEKILNPQVEYEVEEEDPAATAAAASAAPTTEPVPINTLEKDDGTGTLIPTDFNYGTEKGSLFIENSKTGKHAYFKIGVDPTTNKQILLYSIDENKLGGHFKQVMERASQGRSPDDVLRNIIDKYLNLDAYAKNKILNKKTTNIGNFMELLEKGPYQIEPIKKGIKKRALMDTSGKRFTRFGAGVNDPKQELPEYAFFGNIVIMLRKLYYKNVLSVKSKSGRIIDGLYNSKVSNSFVDIIMDMYADKDVSSLIKALKNDEKHLINSIIYQAGLHKKIAINTNETLTELKNQHKTIEGEILAGNNNPEVLKELNKVLFKLHHLGAISIPAMKKYLKQFS